VQKAPPAPRHPAARPSVAIAVGYVTVSLIMAGVVAAQSGLAVGATSAVVNTVVLTPSAGIAWALGRLVEHRVPSGQAWWMTRAQGHLAAFITSFTLAFLPVEYAAQALQSAPETAGLAWEEISLALVLGLTVATGLPLVFAFAVEGLGRRANPAGAPVGVRGPRVR